MLNTIVEILEKGIVIIKDLIINLSPAYGDYILLAFALGVAYLIEIKKNIQPWKIWIPIGIMIFLALKFAGG